MTTTYLIAQGKRAACAQVGRVHRADGRRDGLGLQQGRAGVRGRDA